MPRVSAAMLLQADEVAFEFYRASGPGGQNVNKVSTAVRLRFDLRRSRLLPDEVKERLARLAGRRVTEAGVLAIEARRFRTQERNREEAMARLLELIRRAETPPRERRATRPTAGAQERRLQAKKRRGAVKRVRRAPGAAEE
ncbi:MAG: alternative ribosome rescue aminoacyl-tRNA hydrolase ArfB [Candidatus Methylomirabilales bacterium]